MTGERLKLAGSECQLPCATGSGDILAVFCCRSTADVASKKQTAG